MSCAWCRALTMSRRVGRVPPFQAKDSTTCDGISDIFHNQGESRGEKPNHPQNYSVGYDEE